MKKKKLIIVIAGLMLLVAIGAGWLLVFSPWAVDNFRNLLGVSNVSAKGKESRQDTKGHMYKMDSMIVNLADPGQSRYLKIKLDIESSEKKANEEFEKRLPQLRDALLKVLGGKQRKEIIDSEGKERLRGEIKDRLNQLLNNMKIKEVYFTEFLMQ
ncbi:MAG: flagellar basal body protein FliL [Deltaproteobacteria bacterium]|nr:flagellar basal body protein FliL [Deltaproteobacteria bacterium]